MVEKQLKVWFASSLLRWNKEQNNRKMPWKGIKDPYRIWLSEVILQQTRVAQGMEYYNRFLESYPNIHSLAQANDNEVFKLWEGLGYYNRCRNLLFTAREISQKRKGVFPATYEGLLLLKGVGSYTAAAVGSFAFGLSVAVVDGNVLRVLSRVFGIDKPIDKKEGKFYLEQLAQELLDKKDPGKYNQAIMDLGATVCTPRSPHCHVCPFRKICVAFATGKPEMLPIKSKKPVVRNRFFYYLHVECKGEVLIRKRGMGDIWSGLHEFVLIEKDEPAEERDVNTLVFWGIDTSVSIKSKRLSIPSPHQLTHQRIHCMILYAELNKKINVKGYTWVGVQEINRKAFPRLITRYLSGT